MGLGTIDQLSLSRRNDTFPQHQNSLNVVVRAGGSHRLQHTVVCLRRDVLPFLARELETVFIYTRRFDRTLSIARNHVDSNSSVRILARRFNMKQFNGGRRLQDRKVLTWGKLFRDGLSFGDGLSATREAAGLGV
jgi:hypothetical protein